MRNYFDKLFDWMKDCVDEENDDIRREEGIRYLHSEDRYWNIWVCEVVEKIEVGDSDFETYCENATEEQYEFLKADINQFLTKQFHWENRDKLIEERREENARDARTQAMEMGYNNYAGGVYWREW